jgi:hypothetical protein
MREIKNPKVIVAKGLLFLVAGSAAAVLLLLETPTLRSVLLLGVAIWAFCRFYYFAFYTMWTRRIATRACFLWQVIC